MATATNREEFAARCLRELGAPVIEINVDDDQVDDRIDDALQYFRDFHYDGSHHTYMNIEITQTDIDNGYFTIPEEVAGIVGVFPVTSYMFASSSTLFSIKYHFHMNMLQNGSYTMGNLSNYAMTMEYLSLMDQTFNGQQPIRYNRHMNKLYVDTDKENFNVGDYLTVNCYVVVDPDAYTDVWGDRWLHKYATQLIKRQWGTNLKKFTGMQLPGGIQFNGEQIYQEAEEEIKRLEEEMISTYSIPAFDMIG